tara:strand:+ start:1251 stop:1484 length:234 start_codon:yes stop_codon:yes gene_type:complete
MVGGKRRIIAGFLGLNRNQRRKLKADIEDPSLLVSVLDFILMEDQWVIDFCDAVGFDPHKLQAVRSALPGGETLHWT